MDGASMAAQRIGLLLFHRGGRGGCIVTPTSADYLPFVIRGKPKVRSDLYDVK